MEQDIVFAVVLSALLILLLIAALVAVFFIWSRQRTREAMRMAETQLAFEKEMRKIETEVAEQIKSQFAQELHDNIGQSLTSLHFEVQNQKLSNPLWALGLQSIEIYLSEVSQNLRLLSQTLNNDYIGKAGLWAVIQTQVDRLHRLGRFKIHTPVLKGHVTLSKEHQLIVFRIFQEITQNALKHSEAQNLYIYGEADDDRFELKVVDDGCGFDPEQIKKTGKGSGLGNMVNRARIAGLESSIVSEPGKGCTIEIKTPKP